MLVQLIKELGLLLLWRELALKPKEPEQGKKRKLGFKTRHAPGFETMQLVATWALALFLLSVSVPHSIEVIHRYEKGSDQFRELKSVLLAITIEIIAALVLLIGLHTTKLSQRQRLTLFGLAAPFVLLTLHLQFVYYAGLEEWLVYPWELAAVLPGGVLVCAIVVAFLWPTIHLQERTQMHSHLQPGVAPSQPVNPQVVSPNQSDTEPPLRYMVEQLARQLPLLAGQVETLTSKVSDLGETVGTVAIKVVNLPSTSSSTTAVETAPGVATSVQPQSVTASATYAPYPSQGNLSPIAAQPQSVIAEGTLFSEAFAAGDGEEGETAVPSQLGGANELRPDHQGASEIAELLRLSELAVPSQPSRWDGAADSGSEMQLENSSLVSTALANAQRPEDQESAAETAVENADRSSPGEATPPQPEIELDRWLRQAGLTRGKALEGLATMGIQSASAAFSALKFRYGTKLPQLTETRFRQLYRELVAEVEPELEGLMVPSAELLLEMGNVERDCWAYRMRVNGWTYTRIANAFGKTSDNSGKTYVRTHAERFGLPQR